MLRGSGGGLTKGMFRKLTRRSQFHNYLPYIAYDAEKQIYHNIDNTVGLMWECVPLYFSDSEVAGTLEGLFRLPFPEGSVMQFILYADPYIKPTLDHYVSTKTRSSALLQKSAQSLSRFLNDGTKGVPNFGGIPLRNFRLFVSLKMPMTDTRKIDFSFLSSSIGEILKGGDLVPHPLEAKELIETLARLFNDSVPDEIPYNDEIPIRKQIIFSDTPVKSEWDRLMIGNKSVRVITPKSCPKESSIMGANIVTGDIWGLKSDANQIFSPFFITYNVIFENLKSAIHKKCSLVLQQQGMGSLSPSLARKKDEFLWAVDQVDGGSNFFRVIPVVTVVGDDDRQAMDSVVRMKRLWEQQGFIMQEDKGIIPVLFLSSLPLGFYNVGDNVKDLDRDFILPTRAITEMLPVQADFCGGSAVPEILFTGRKGQLITVDLFDRRANNSNALIAAQSGGGKSFFINYTVFNYFGSGKIIRIVDIGRSYEKVCEMMGGKFVEFSENSKICLNPFTNVVDVEKDLAVIAAIACQMVYSASDKKADETESTLIKDAVRWAYSEKGSDACIDDVHYFLQNYPDKAEEVIHVDHIKETAKLLAFNMRDFISSGTYGKWFNGRANLDIANDEFVVLELEELKTKTELFKVVTLQLLNAVTQDLYLSDRSRKRMIIFDEAWQFFQEGGFIEKVIEEGYRRARKYGGSFTTITQSLLDLKKFGPVGEIIKGNSAFQFFLPSSDFETARAEKVIDFNDFQMSILKSLKTVPPRYSELFFHTPFATGIARLAVDEYSFHVYNSDADINAHLMRICRKKGVTYDKAIELKLTNAA